MFGKYEFAGRYEVQFVLAGLRIDTDTQCGGGGDSGYSEDSEDSDYSEDSDTPDYYEDGGEEETVQYQEEDTEDTYSVFDEFLGQFYNEEEDEDWTPDVE